MTEGKFLPIIGLEVHVELRTKSKMFCSCQAEHFGVKPNTHTCPVCLGLPGSLPVPNRKAMEWTILVGLALGCQINQFSKFDRKNYFYPDLPKGYQISQYDMPLAVNGQWRIRRVHLEEDTGKLIHQKGDSFIDFNRAGVPLMEIVTEPDFSSAEEVKIFLQKLQQLVRYLGVAEAEMEKGEMRCEPNVNLKITEGGKIYFTPIVEIKNINSFRFVERAIDYEIKRQFAEFKKTGIEKGSGNKETRGWDEVKKMTFLQREKEEEGDYRYFPEPDIPPLRWSQSQILNLKSQIPELPKQKLARFIRRYGLTKSQAEILVTTHQKADYFEKAVAFGRRQNLDPKQIANWVINKPANIAQLSLQQLVETIIGQVPTVKEEELEKVIETVMQENQSAVTDYQKGKAQALEFLVGQVARQTKGKADPNLARKLLLEILQKAP